MRRRDFATLLFGSAAFVAWHSASAQSADNRRKVAALFSQAEGDPEGQARVKAFLQGLEALGWTEGTNFKIDVRWAAAVTIA